MKVIYESYIRRHRSGQNHNNNNGGEIENCHSPPDYVMKSANPPAAREMDSDLARTNCRHIISYDSLVINKELGVGEFGVVQQGVWTNGEGQRIQVAIKCLSAARLENNRLEFLKEASIMHSIYHEHIVTLYGVVLEPSIMLVTELAPLRSLLECLKETTLIAHFPVISLCIFAAQIADGMAYLESKRLIHRDLAARNILVFNKNKVKISDFGLSRALGVGKDYYQSNFNVNLKLPIAWCAPECINYLKFTSQSDVWAYGVTLWEMFSFGFQPWAALTGQQILEAIDKPNYQRLEQPECCPKEYYQLMLKCWTHEPNLRPKFSEIVNMLPDCKPELLQSIRNSRQSNRKEELSYKTGEIITVIDKTGDSTEPGFESFWKGVNNQRKTGYFNPSDFVAYLGQNLPCSSSNNLQFVPSGSVHGNNQSSSHNSLASTITSTVLQSSKFIRGFLESKAHHNSHSSPHGGRKARLRPEMISKPQGDLKHTGHVGADGLFFGDVSFLEGKYQHLAKTHSNSSSIDMSSGEQPIRPNKRQPMLSNPIISFARNSLSNGNSESATVNSNYNEENHEYHEISDEDDMGPLESPPFEVLDFGPSLMEEVFRELDHIKPELNNETADSETAINESSINVKNEVRELNLKINKEANNCKKKQSAVKSISEAEQNELDSAIAMAKDIANRTMFEDELDLVRNDYDSPKTPNSPTKRKFSFKFPTHKSGERRTFSEETESIGDIIESITPAAKEAYLSLVEKGVSASGTQCTLPNKKESSEKRPDVKPPPPPPLPPLTTLPQSITMPVTTFNVSLPTASSSVVVDSVAEMDTNPLRMLRTAGIGNVLRPKVRGNRSFSQPRLPTTSSLARVASSRSQLGSPPPVPNSDEFNNNQTGVNLSNALPLPPRDRSRPLIQLKTHQRRHPLVIPPELAGIGMGDNYNSPIMTDDLHYDPTRHDSPPQLHRHVPVLKQVSCPRVPQAFLNVHNKTNDTNNKNAVIGLTASLPTNDCDAASAVIPPTKHNMIYLSDDLTESLESEMQKAFETIKLNQSKEVPQQEVQHSTNDTNDLSTSTSQQTNYCHVPMIASVARTPVTSSMPVESAQNGFSELVAKDKQPNQKRSCNVTNSIQNKNDCDEIRVMQKVLGTEVNLSDDECNHFLTATEWDIHRAIKCVRLRQQLRPRNIEVDWAQMLAKFNWNMRQASNYLIATQGVPEETTEV